MTISAVRPAQFAGQFYPDDKAELTHYLERILLDHVPEGGEVLNAQGCFVPHAGYVFSGECAARTLALIDIPDTVIILHTKHVSFGPTLSISPYGTWETPLGPTPIASKIASRLDQLGPAKFDENAEEGEHAAEVVLPFLQMLNKEVRCCVISVGRIDNDETKILGSSIAQVCKEFDEREILILASTDMNHYASKIETEKLDDIALEKMEEMDPSALLEVVKKNSISMCGACATAAMMHACKELGSEELVVVNHCTSGDVNGDYDQVVGYASGYVR